MPNFHTNPWCQDCKGRCHHTSLRLGSLKRGKNCARDFLRAAKLDLETCMQFALMDRLNLVIKMCVCVLCCACACSHLYFQSVILTVVHPRGSFRFRGSFQSWLCWWHPRKWRIFRFLLQLLKPLVDLRCRRYLSSIPTNWCMPWWLLLVLKFQKKEFNLTGLPTEMSFKRTGLVRARLLGPIYRWQCMATLPRFVTMEPKLLEFLFRCQQFGGQCLDAVLGGVFLQWRNTSYTHIIRLTMCFDAWLTVATFCLMALTQNIQVRFCVAAGNLQSQKSKGIGSGWSLPCGFTLHGRSQTWCAFFAMLKADAMMPVNCITVWMTIQIGQITMSQRFWLIKWRPWMILVSWQALERFVLFWEKCIDHRKLRGAFFSGTPKAHTFYCMDSIPAYCSHAVCMPSTWGCCTI